MSDRIESQLSSSATPLAPKRGLRNGIAIAIVAIISTLLVIFAPKTEVITTNLSGEGCGKTEAQNVSCILKSGEKELVLRECSEENPCSQSAYELGKRDKNIQYIVLTSEVFAQSIQVEKIDLDSMTQSEVDSAFFVGVKDECRESNTVYKETCFDFPVSDAQRQDIWEQNNKYESLLKEYRQ